MKYTVLTLFPEMIEGAMHTGILGRAIGNGLLSLRTVQIRDFADNARAQIDDYTYGGGAGMLIQAEPVYRAYLAAVQAGDMPAQEGTSAGLDAPVSSGKRPRTIYLTPQGVPFTQRLAQEYAREEEILFLCGHYEGVDERVLEEIVTDRVSIGDYVLTGGELPALVVMDAVARLLPGVLGNEESPDVESFSRGLLEYPQYTRPEIWRGKGIPEVLLTGDHQKIEGWRLERAKERTAAVRPDLYETYEARERAIALLARRKRENIPVIDALSADEGTVLAQDEKYLLAEACGMRYLCRIDREPGEPSAQMKAQLGADWEPYPCIAALYTERCPVPPARIRALPERDREEARRVADFVRRRQRELRVPYELLAEEDARRRELLEALGFYFSEKLLAFSRRM